MRDPEDEGIVFPLAAARALARELDQAAAWLDEATGARAQARAAMPEFQGAYAERYRDAVDHHAGVVSGVVDRLRANAGRLRTAVDEHLEMAQQVRRPDCI